MKNLVNIIFPSLLALALFQCCNSGENKRSTQKDSFVELDSTKVKTIEFDRETYIHMELDYRDASGKGIVIENSYPRGGGPIITSTDRHYGHAVFWTSILNNKDLPIELKVHSPADSVVILPASDSYFKLMVPPNEMSSDLVSVFSFGLNNIESFVNNNLNQATEFQKTIPPNGEAMFYVILLSHFADYQSGVSRTGLYLEGGKLYYKLTIDSLNFKSIPFGEISF